MTSQVYQMSLFEKLDTLTLSAEDFRAKLSQLLESEEDLKIQEELSSLKSQDSQVFSNLNIFSARTLKDSFSKTRRGRVGRQVANTLLTSGNQGVVTEDLKIRKLTPRECWRLQAFPDWAFDKAQEVNSKTQLYKQAGNSVTVNVIKSIAERLK